MVGPLVEDAGETSHLPETCMLQEKQPVSMRHFDLRPFFSWTHGVVMRLSWYDGNLRAVLSRFGEPDRHAKCARSRAYTCQR